MKKEVLIAGFITVPSYKNRFKSELKIQFMFHDCLFSIIFWGPLRYTQHVLFLPQALLTMITTVRIKFILGTCMPP